MKDWKTVLDFAEDKLDFKEKNKSVNLRVSEGGHMLAKLELVRRWNNDDAVFLVKKEENVSNFKAVKKIHKILNHKQKEQMYYAYRNARRMNDETKKVIDDVVDKCEVCKKRNRSKSKPSVAISRVSDFNSVVSLDLKAMEEKHILWMICAFMQ